MKKYIIALAVLVITIIGCQLDNDVIIRDEPQTTIQQEREALAMDKSIAHPNCFHLRGCYKLVGGVKKIACGVELNANGECGDNKYVDNSPIISQKGPTPSDGGCKGRYSDGSAYSVYYSPDSGQWYVNDILGTSSITPEQAKNLCPQK